MNQRRYLSACALAALFLLVASARPGLTAAPAAADPAYAESIAAWHRQRNVDMGAADGWLSLVGLFWLQEGENRFGSGAGNRVIFPAGTAPAEAGAMVRHGQDVAVHAAPGVAITADGKPLPAELSLRSDAKTPPVLSLGSLRFFVIQRGDRVGVRVKDTKSPALAAFRGIDSYPTRPEWRFDARYEPYNPPKKIAIANVLGMVTEGASEGAVVFEVGGQSYRLDALQSPEDGSLSLIFGDGTNGHETYGSGRFLDTDPPKDGRVVVDFNRAYNPPCAFTAFATCPLPPKQNKLALRIEAGEKNYGEGHR